MAINALRSQRPQRVIATPRGQFPTAVSGRYGEMREPLTDSGMARGTSNALNRLRALESRNATASGGPASVGGFAPNQFNAGTQQNDPFADTPNVGGAFSSGGLAPDQFNAGTPQTFAGDPSGTLGGSRGTGAPGDPLFGSGQAAADPLAGGAEDGYQFRTTPGYEFRLQQAQESLENSAASRGGLLSGNTLKDLTQFSQGMAEQEFRNVFDMLGSVRTGNPAGQMANAAMQTGSNIGNLQRASGRAQAQGALAQSDAWQRGIGGGLGFLSTIVGGNETLSPINTASLPDVRTPESYMPGG